MIKKRLLSLCFALIIAISLAAIGCGGGDAGPKPEGDGGAQPTASTLPKFAPKGDEGTLSGKVEFEGKAPEPRKIQMDADDFCAKKNADAVADDEIVNDGKLQNVIVYVKDGPAKKFSYDVPTDQVTLDQQDCQYKPHVVALQTKQKLKVTTSDATIHNVHPVPQNNKEWSKTQQPNGEALVESFSHPDIIPFKCNQHPWMKAYVGIFDHPYFSVTGKDGAFTLKNLPPGEYTLEAWHEKLGTQTQKVTVGPKEEKKDITFKFNGEAKQSKAEGVSTSAGAALVLPILNSK